MGFKKWFRNSKVAIALFFTGILVLIVGLVINLTSPKNLLETKATIKTITETYDYATESYDYTVIVTYTIDGTNYEEQLGYYDGSMKEGKEIIIKYDPASPNKPHGNTSGMLMYLFIAGGILSGIGVLGGVITAVKMKSFASTTDMEALDASYQISDNRQINDYETTYYFAWDKKPIKQGYYLEDKNRNKLFEAKMIKNSLVSAYEYVFINCKTGVETKHLVGHMSSSSIGSSNMEVTLNSTITFDGEDIWKFLKKRGIEVSVDTLGIAHYSLSILYKDKVIANAEACSQYVHEEDEEAHPALSKIIAPGFYRLTTKEVNLEILFLVLFVLSRVDISARQLS